MLGWQYCVHAKQLPHGQLSLTAAKAPPTAEAVQAFTGPAQARALAAQQPALAILIAGYGRKAR